MIKYIADQQHYNEVLSLCASVRHTLWIGTADIKDLYVKSGVRTVPFLSVLSALAKRGVSIRIIHTKKPGKNFQDDFRLYPNLKTDIEMMLCPRTHFKIIVFDSTSVYIGSANLTGAALGMKGPNKRNFEAGILTSLPTLLDPVIEHFDSLWCGSRCHACQRKQFCEIPLK